MVNLEQKITKILDKSVSIFLLITAISLVVFMFIQVGFELIDLFHNMIEVQTADNANRGSLLNKLNAEYLHGVALIILLVKAYKIVMSYADDHHIDIRYMVEIAIIGSILELLFNADYYTVTMQIVLVVLGLGSAVIYHIFYPFTIKETESELQAKKKIQH